MTMLSTSTGTSVHAADAKHSPKRRAHPHRTALTKTKVLMMLGLALGGMLFASWHGHKRQVVHTLSPVTVEGNAASYVTEPAPAAGAATAAPATSCPPCPPAPPSPAAVR